MFDRLEQVERKVQSVENVVSTVSELSAKVSEIESFVSTLGQEFERVNTMLSEILSRIESVREQLTVSVSATSQSSVSSQVSVRDLGDLVKMLLEVKDALDRVYDFVKRYVSVVYRRRSSTSS
jgi:methyl-accepting chemotaxis protein